MNKSLENHQKELLTLKNEFQEFHLEISTLKNELKNLNNNYEKDFLDIDKNYIKKSSNINNASEKDKETSANLENELPETLNRFSEYNYNIHPNASTALTVLKKPGLLNVINTTKKVTKFSLKSLLVSLGITILNLFI